MCGLFVHEFTFYFQCKNRFYLKYDLLYLILIINQPRKLLQNLYLINLYYLRKNRRQEELYSFYSVFNLILFFRIYL